jgi:hypothetical protein
LAEARATRRDSSRGERFRLARIIIAAEEATNKKSPCAHMPAFFGYRLERNAASENPSCDIFDIVWNNTLA